MGCEYHHDHWAIAVSTLRRVNLWAAVSNSVFAGVIVVVTFLVAGTSIPAACVWVAFGLTFPIFGAAVAPLGRMRWGTRSHALAVTWDRNRAYWRRARERIPRTFAVAIAVIFVLGWFAGFTAILQVKGGSPQRQRDHYFSNNHGVLIPLTEGEYSHQLAVGYRGFAAISMALCAVAVGLALADPSRPESGGIKP